jgi:hypothetical protein
MSRIVKVIIILTAFFSLPLLSAQGIDPIREEEERLIDALSAELSLIGVATSRFQAGTNDEPSFSSVLYAEGGDSSGGLFCVALPLDSLSASSNIPLRPGLSTLGLDFAARAIAAGRDGPGWALAFLPSDDQGHLGALALAERLSRGGKAAIFCVEESERNGIGVSNGGKGLLSPRWLFDAAFAAASLAAGDEARAEEAGLPERLGLSGSGSPLEPYFARGLPAILMRIGPDSRESAEFLIEAIHKLGGKIPDRWDRHYVRIAGLLPLGQTDIVVLVVFSILASVGLVLFSSIRWRERFVPGFYSSARKAWLLAPIIGIFAFGFYAGWGLASLIAGIRGFQGLPGSLSPLALAFSACFALGIFFPASDLAKRWMQKLDARIFTSFCLFASISCLLAYSIVSLSLFPYFVTQSFAACLLIFRFPRGIRSVILALFPLPMLVLAFDILSSGEAAARIMPDSPGGVAICASTALPCLLAALVAAQRSGRRFAGRRVSPFSVGAGIACAALGIALSTAWPLGSGEAQPVAVKESAIGGAASLVIDSAIPLGDFLLARDGIELPVRGAGARYQAAYEDAAAAWGKGSISKREGYSIARIELGFEGWLSGVTLKVGSPSRLVVLDASLPYSVAPGGNYALFLAGARPPNPLKLEFAMSGAHDALSVDALVTWSQHPRGLGVRGSTRAFDARLERVEELEFEIRANR